MKFGEKFDYARELAACLAYLLAKQHDLAGLCAIDDSVRWEMPPRFLPRSPRPDVPCLGNIGSRQ